MKRFFSYLAATAMLFAASCSNEDLGTNDANDTQVTFNLSLEGQSGTRAIGDGTSVTDLHYAVFDADGNRLPQIEKVYREDEFSATDNTANVKLTLAKDQTYTVVFWAQHKDADYSISDDMVVTVTYAANSNNEKRDAFFKAETFKVTGSESINVVLTRPFAQLNVGVTEADYEAAKKSGVEITKSWAKVTGVYNTLNLLDGKVSNVNFNGVATFDWGEKPSGQKLEVEQAEYVYLSMNYVLVNERENVAAKFRFSNGTETKPATKFINFNSGLDVIPVQRNYRTNLVGQILTGNLDFNVTIKPGFQDINVPAPMPEVKNDAEALAAALTANKEHIVVTLDKDIDLPISTLGQQTGGSGEYKLGGENTKSITIDLNGKTLNVTTTYWSNLGAKNDDAVFTIKNGTMTSSQATGTWNSYDLTFSNCNYIIENVVFEKAVAFDNAGKNVTLKGVTINETHDYYAMWITAEGQTVTIDGLTVNSNNGRGIKIDEQYVDTPAKVTLNVKNATFKTAKKAAILVKSVAGAEINAENLNIANVAADKKFAVWVDEDAAAHADKVVVNGAYKAVEGNIPTTISTKEELLALSAKAFTGNNGKAEEHTIMLLNDIDMENAEFSAMIAQRGDKLTIIGNGYTISNIKVVSGAEDNTTGQASMFYCYPNSTLEVSNLKIKNITVTADKDDTGYAAALVGYCEGKAIFNNVDVENANVTGVKSSGMIVGHLSGNLTATDCDFKGTVTLADYAAEPAGHYAGKYIGTLAGPATMTNCTVDATVSGNLKAGNEGDVYGRKTAAGSLN